MTTPREHLLHWLRDAYAMEQQAVEICERQAERIKNYPNIADRVALHLKETHGQIAKLERCFTILDEDPSVLKSALGKLAGNMQAIGGMLASDEIVKSAMAAYVFEEMEIASYTVLITAAEAAGEPEIARICQDILAQEEAMAEFLAEHLPGTTAAFLTRDAANMDARR